MKSKFKKPEVYEPSKKDDDALEKHLKLLRESNKGKWDINNIKND